MDPLTLALLAGAAGGAKMGQGFLTNRRKRNQAIDVANATNRANLKSDFARAQKLAFEDDEMIRLHNYQVDAYDRFIPRAFNRATLAYQDNNATLTELIDQYQFTGQDRLAKSVAERGSLAARGITGRGAMTDDVAQSSAMGRGDALMARNLMAARYGIDRANLRIRQQLEDSLQTAYNKVGFTPKRTPGGVFQTTDRVKPSYSGNDMLLDNFGSALQGIETAAAAYMGGVPGLKKNGYDEQRYQERYETPGPEGDGIPEGEFPGALPPIPTGESFNTSRDALKMSNNIGGFFGPSGGFGKAASFVNTIFKNFR